MTRHQPVVSIVIVATAFAWAAACMAGCSSVPDIRFVDDEDDAGDPDAGSEASSEVGDAGGDDADGPDDEPRRCNDETFEDGVCCGWKYCVGCERIDCFECFAMTSCSGTDEEACCKRGGEERLTCSAVGRCR